jgi:hypothetical protein
MWQLKTADRGEPWADLGEFDSVTAATRRIIELEDYPVTAVFFEMLVEQKATTNKKPSPILNTPA